MKISSIVSFSLLVSLFSCGQASEKSGQAYKKSHDTGLNSEIYKKDTSDFGNLGSTAPDYIIFGVYCGECSNHCATMYQYNTGGNSNTLLVDSTDSYFKNHGNIKFKKSVGDIRRFYLAQSIFKQIPAELLTTTKPEESFGCPDCTDGCGIYFEFQQGGKVKKFYMDYQTGKLPLHIKKFAEYLKTTIAQLNAKG